jgi:hypothetical protein
LETFQRNPSDGGLGKRDEIGLIGLYPFNPAGNGSFIAWSAIYDSHADLQLMLRDIAVDGSLFRRGSRIRQHGRIFCGSEAIKGGNSNTGSIPKPLSDRS